MGLEDLAMMCAEPGFTVLYPSDATSAWRATALIAAHDGPCYLRLGRPAVPVLYGEQEPFAIGRCKVLRKSDQDRALIVAAGITVFEALAAYEQLQAEGLIVRVIDLFSIHPIDGEELVASARDSGGIVVTVEDHYRHGGLGDAVLSALARHEMRVCKLAVSEIRAVAPAGNSWPKPASRLAISVMRLDRRSMSSTRMMPNENSVHPAFRAQTGPQDSVPPCRHTRRSAASDTQAANGSKGDSWQST